MRILESQSAMEYLMTYSWAILLLAITLGALFYIGVLGGASAHKGSAPPGACRVVRPNGVNTTQFISLNGECNGALPQYVAQFSGQNSYVNLGNNPSLSPEAGSSGKMTVCGWFDVLSLNNYYGFLIKGKSFPSSGSEWEYTIGQGNSESYIVWTGSGTNIATYTVSLPAVSTWYFTCFAYNYATGSAFTVVNKTVYSASFTSGVTATAGTGNLILGSGESGFSNVELANFQIYNTSLSTNEIKSLYLEGIGGAPIDLQNLVGWWPLNGNAQDYSGNNNNGQINGPVLFNTSWESGYTTP
jgi:hypothetical protein